MKGCDEIKMILIRHALEVALHELVTQNGLHVTDVQDINFTWDIDNSEAIKLIENALATLSERKDM